MRDVIAAESSENKDIVRYSWIHRVSREDSGRKEAGYTCLESILNIKERT
jgi:hypothetical protein